MRRPDILFFMMDQLSAKWLEAAVGGVCPMPHVERLMSSGATFSSCFTSNPVCSAARSTLATGLTTRGHGVLENGYRLSPELPTFMRMLQEAGWRTGAMGKLHFLPHFAGLRPDYLPYGFDVARITEDPRGGEWLDWVESERPEHYESALATVWTSYVPEFAAYGPDKINMRRRIDEIRAHFDWTTERFPGNTAEHYTFPFPESMSQTAWITDRAIEFIQSTPKERPFFAQVSHVQPHSPYCAPEDCMDSVDAAKIPEPVEAEWTRDPFAPAYFRNRKPADADWMSVRRYYFASLAYLDRQLGRILEALEKAGRLSQTHIFLLSDHGDLLGDHGLSGKYEKHYDACARVPLIVAGPGLKRGIVTDRLVQLEDILPTILDIAGVQAPPMPKTGPLLATPAEHIPQFPGRSLLPILRGESTGDWRQAAYCESFNSTKSDDPGDWARTIITDKRRYTVYPGGGDQLFDRRKDPDELHNLAGNPLFAADRRRLRDELLEMIVLRDYPKPRRELFAFGVH